MKFSLRLNIYGLVIVIFLFCFSITVYSQSISVLIKSPKPAYSNYDSLLLNIVRDGVACNIKHSSFYVELLNANMQTVFSHVYMLTEESRQVIISLQNLLPGNYILRAYTQQQLQYHPTAIKHYTIGVNVPSTSNLKEEVKVLSVFPEGGQAILNFKSLFLLRLQTLQGHPLQEIIRIYTANNQLIGRGQTDGQGWLSLDIPILANEVLQIRASDGSVLKTIHTNSDPLVKSTGFSLRTQFISDNISIEIQKAEDERRKKVNLFVYDKDKPIYTKQALFKDDTTIVETHIPVKGIENKLLKFFVIDEDGVIVATRRFIATNAKVSELETEIKNNLFCNQLFTLPCSQQEINSQLLANHFLISAVERSREKESGFSLFFKVDTLIDESFNYQLIDSNNLVLQTGNVFANKNGIMEIDGCDFKGNATVIFSLNATQQRSKIELIAPPIQYSDEMIKLLQPQLVTNVTKHQAANVTADSSTSLVTPEKILELKEITISAEQKNRDRVLENRYIQNGYFRNMNSINIDVESDLNAVQYDLYTYLQKSIPGLIISRSGQSESAIVYRMGSVDVFIDEQRVSGIPFSGLQDIGYIKFIKEAVYGLTNAGGGLMRGKSNIAGTTGTLLIYTKKYVDKKSNKNFLVEIPVKGY